MNPPDFSMQDQIKCVERELHLRRVVYPRWVGQEKMTKGVADREIACMEAVLETLRQVGRAEEQAQEAQGVLALF